MVVDLMVEPFRNPQINRIAAKRYLIALTIFLLLVGAVSVQVRGFNLGVDFTGGTLMTVRFKDPPDLDKVRAALGRSGIDTSKVTLQPVVTRPTEVLIHAPQLADGTEAERRVDQDKRAITAALQRLNPGGDESTGRMNINSIEPAGIEAELRQAHRARQRTRAVDVEKSRVVRVSGQARPPDAYELFILSLSRSYAGRVRVNREHRLNPEGK